MGHSLYVAAYGRDGSGKGIEELSFDAKSGKLSEKDFFPLAGKCNLIMEYGEELLTAEEEKSGCYLKLYTKDFQLVRSRSVDVFYNFGQITGSLALLGSYADGVDSVYDIEEDRLVGSSRHAKEKGHTHFIFQHDDQKIYSVENLFDQIIIYGSTELKAERVVDFGGEKSRGIRLLRVNREKGLFYINTEKTNELLTLRAEDLSVLHSLTLTEDPASYSGGLDYKEEESLLAVGLRGRDTIVVCRTDEDGLPHMLYEFSCGAKPRDLLFLDGYLLASCSGEDRIEVYRIGSEKAELVQCFPVLQPITFSV